MSLATIITETISEKKKGDPSCQGTGASELLIAAGRLIAPRDFPVSRGEIA